MPAAASCSFFQASIPASPLPLFQLIQPGECFLHREEDVQQFGVEYAARSAADHLQHLCPREGILVDPPAAQCVVYVGQRDDLCPGRDLILLQAVRVPAPVPALMVMAGDVTGIVIGTVLLQLRNSSQQPGPLGRVGLHDLKLFRRQAAGFVQNGVGNGDLPTSCMTEARAICSMLSWVSPSPQSVCSSICWVMS